MGSPKKPPSHEWINLDKEFHLEQCRIYPNKRAEPVITGLSEEEDAQRHLAVRFNPDLRVCVNCEIMVDVQVGFCPRCLFSLAPIGTSPLRRKSTK